MANEIYDSSWWGNTIDTASSIGTSTEMIQGQFNLTKIGAEEVTNGDFATDSDWSLTQATIQDGQLLLSTTDGSYTAAIQTLGTVGKLYRITLDVADIIGTISVVIGGGTDVDVTTNGTHTLEIVSVSTTFEIKRKFGVTNVSATIDNVSVKEVRATSVEAVKCLADAIHRIGIQNIQN